MGCLSYISLWPAIEVPRRGDRAHVSQQCWEGRPQDSTASWNMRMGRCAAVAKWSKEALASSMLAAAGLSWCLSRCMPSNSIPPVKKHSST